MRTSVGKTNSKIRCQTRKPQSKHLLTLTSSLALNQEYSSLLSELARLTYTQPNFQNQRAYLFDLLTVLKDIQKCHFREKISCFKTADHKLRDFIKNRQLHNAGNLIGKYEQLRSEIEYCLERIRAAEEEEALLDEQSPDEQESLRRELAELVKRRIQLQNRQEMIEQQVTMAEKQAANEKAQLLEEEMYGYVKIGSYEVYSEEMIQNLSTTYNATVEVDGYQ